MTSLENSIIRLLKKRPFYGHFILNLRRIKSSGDRTAGVTITNGIPTIAINTSLFDELPKIEQEAILEHLVKHLLHLHPLRRNNRNQHDWDICCDLAINQTIEGLPDYAVLPQQFDMENNLAAEEYYQQLSTQFTTGNLDGNGYGDGEQEDKGATGKGRADAKNSNTLDDHEIWSQADSTPVKLAEEMIRSITRHALQGGDGEMPDDLRQIVQGILHPSPIPWNQILRQFLATAGRVGKKNSWKREHRRFCHATPGVCKQRRLNLLIGIDVSDSTNTVSMRESFAAELLHIAKGRELQLTVVYANSRIQKIEAFRKSPTVLERYDGGGFTDLRPLFEYAKSLQPPPAAVIYITDGIGSAPENMEFPTLWVLTTDGEKPVPWGVELRLTV